MNVIVEGSTWWATALGAGLGVLAGATVTGLFERQRRKGDQVARRTELDAAKADREAERVAARLDRESEREQVGADRRREFQVETLLDLQERVAEYVKLTTEVYWAAVALRFSAQPATPAGGPVGDAIDDEADRTFRSLHNRMGVLVVRVSDRRVRTAASDVELAGQRVRRAPNPGAADPDMEEMRSSGWEFNNLIGAWFGGHEELVTLEVEDRL